MAKKYLVPDKMVVCASGTVRESRRGSRPSWSPAEMRDPEGAAPRIVNASANAIIPTRTVVYQPMSVQVTDRGPQRGDTVLDLIGNTPLLRLRKFEAGLNGVELYGKAEWFNPGGSVKDRPAANMVREGLRSGALRPGKTLLDATSGNTGIAYAMIGAAPGVSGEAVRARRTSRSSESGCCTRTAQSWSSPIRWTARTARFAKRGSRWPRTPICISIRTSTTTTRTGARTTRRPGPRFSHRPKGASRTSSPGSARAARSWAPGAAARDEPVDQADFVSARFAAARPRGPEAHGDRHRAGHLRPVAGR